MNSTQKIVALFLALDITGCSTYSSNIRVGNDMSYVSLGDQREASKTIQVLETTPLDYRIIGELDGKRAINPTFN